MQTIRSVPKPYPYLVIDGMVEEESLAGMRRNWPGEGYFIGEIPGNFVCDVGQFVYEGSGFWGLLIHNMTPRLIVTLLALFSEHLERRFPGERNFFVSNCSLMQSLGSYGGHDVHTHHYHDPEWVMTVLVYLDYEKNGHNGTTLLKVREGLDPAVVAAQTMDWQDMTEEVETIAYKRGRILAFYETPVSFHSVKASKPGAIFGRRVLRYHIGVVKEHIKRLYGVNLADYQEMRTNPTKDERVIGWLRQDLDMLTLPANGFAAWTHEEKEKWISEIRLGIPAKQRIKVSAA